MPKMQVRGTQSFSVMSRQDSGAEFALRLQIQ